MKNAGTTIVISPLLVLMGNQMEAAEKLGLKCACLNSELKVGSPERAEVLELWKSNHYDLILVTPETLFADDVTKAFQEGVPTGLFVIDEAHCISDWGHDFRLDYGNIYKILERMPSTVPVLATTATANDRVVKDLVTQLGENVFVSRGPLSRESLSIQRVTVKDKVSRYAWILENVQRLQGSGIVYCSTKRDCEGIARFLQHFQIKARSYYSESVKEEENKESERLFLNNEIKVLVSTIKLGMGYDKGDIAFVIHYQLPSNTVAYYQQIGRAGRNIPRAYTFLMCGKEDLDIQNYFINTAFPSEEEFSAVYQFIYENTERGSKTADIYTGLNMSGTRIDKALSFLEMEKFIVKTKSPITYRATVNKYEYNREKYDRISGIRRTELAQMQELWDLKTCYSKFVIKTLDDPSEENCGICSNCLGRDEFPPVPSMNFIEATKEYLNRQVLTIKPRLRYPNGLNYGERISPNQEGICLSQYGDYPYGEFVQEDKYKTLCFRQELVEKSAQLMRENWQNIDAITYVPSLRSDIVQKFTHSLGALLQIPVVEMLSKTASEPQKKMENSQFQCDNAKKSFHLLPVMEQYKSVVLIDDICDSKWTLTICGDLLSKSGVEKVYPFTLSDSSKG